MPPPLPTASSGEAGAHREPGDLERLGAAYAQLGRLRVGSGQDPGRTFAESVRRGLPVEAALQSIGAPASVVRLLESAAPPDPAEALESLLPTLSRADGRMRRLGTVGTYALLTAALCLLLCFHLVLVIHPLLLQFPGGGSPSIQPMQGAWILIGASGLALAALVALVLALKSSAAPWPFATARRGHARALWLSGASVLARQGVPVHTALRAASALVPTPSEARALHALASALEQGRASASAGVDPTENVLFGMVAHASAAGAGTESLTALAHWCDAQIEARWPQVLARAELSALLLAGVAVTASGVLLFTQYLGAILR